MTPTPPPNPIFQGGSSFRYAGGRRPINRNPYDTSHQTPPNPQTPITITPLPDNGVELEELGGEDVGDEDEDEGEEDVNGNEEIEGEENDMDADEEEEGGIDEGALQLRFLTSTYLLFSLIIS